MSLARNRTSANRLKIILDEDTDTYTMCFYRQTLTKCADIKVKDIARYEGVYFDMLQPIFTQVTGLYTWFLTLRRVAKIAARYFLS